MATTGLIVAPDSPTGLRARRIESSYQVSLIADNPEYLRKFMVASQAMQTQALLDANTQLAEVNRNMAGIHEGLGQLTDAVGRGFRGLATSIAEGFGVLGAEMQEGFRLTAAEMQRQNAALGEIAQLLSTKLEGEAREIRNSALAAVREGCSPEAFDQEGSLREALHLFRITVEHPMGVRDYVAWFNIGWLLWKLDGDLPGAEVAFATAVRQSMERKDAYHAMAARHLAYMRYLQRNTEGAAQGAKLALETAPDDPENLTTSLLVAAQAGNEQEVVDTFRTLVSEHPDRLAECLCEPELAAYADRLQAVLDELVPQARDKTYVAAEALSALLDEDRRLAGAIGQATLMSPEVAEQVRVIREMVAQTDIEVADWPTIHALLGGVTSVTRAAMADIDSLRSRVSAVEALRAALARIEWVDVPAGPFVYGPFRGKVALAAFRIMRTPVTVQLYQAYCEAAGVAMPTAPPRGWHNDHPIVGVSWHDAQSFCDYVGLALPTEEQWEKAARGVDGREFPWGDTFETNRCVCSVPPEQAICTEPVGARPGGASPFGCLDMVGNAWEWCADSFEDDERCRILRGGAWYYSSDDYLRVHNRNWDNPDGRHYSVVGFRCVLPAGAEGPRVR